MKTACGQAASLGVGLLGVLLFCLLVYIPVLEAGDATPPKHIGRAFQLTGEVSGRVEGADPIPLVVNGELFSGEEIITQQGASLTIRFRDGSSFSIGPDAKIVLTKYVFNPLASTIQNTVQVQNGGFRYTSGFSVKLPQVAIKMPRISIGVRGTVAEGFVDPDFPTFVGIPNGHGTLENEAGEQSLAEGETAATLAGDKRPSTPGDMPAPVAAQTVQFLEGQIGEVSLTGTPLTTAQQLADAMANRLTVAKQMALTRKATQQGGGTFDKVLAYLVRWFVAFVDKVMTLFDQLGSVFFASLERTLEEISFVRTAWAAASQSLSEALSLLKKAADVGLLEVRDVPLTFAQKAEHQAFLQEADRQMPDAAARLTQHRKKQQARNWENAKQSTQTVIANAAQVAESHAELAGIVQSAVQASPGGTAEMAGLIVRSALSAKGQTDNAETASYIVAAACRADANIASTAAASAVSGLPVEVREQAAALVASAAAKAATQKAGKIAAAVTLVAGDKAAGAIAAAVTLVAKAQAAEVAKAVARVVDPSLAAEVAAAVVQVANSQDAARIAAAVVEAVGPKAAPAVAAAVASVAAAKAAQGIAGAVIESAGGQSATGIAAQIAAAVSMVAGKEMAEPILQEVAKTMGVSAEEMREAVSVAASSGAMQEAMEIGKKAAAKAEQLEEQAQEAAQQADAVAEAAEEIEKLVEEAATPLPEEGAPKSEDASPEETGSEPDAGADASSSSGASSGRGSGSSGSGSSQTGQGRGAQTNGEGGTAEASSSPAAPTTGAVAEVTTEQRLTEAIANGVSVADALSQAMTSEAVTPAEVAAIAVQAGIDPAEVTQAAVSLVGDPEAVAAAAIDAGGDAGAVAAMAILVGGDAGKITAAAMNVGGNPSEVATAAIQAGGSASRVAAAAIRAGGREDQIMAAAVKAGGRTEQVARAVVEAGGDVREVVSAAIRAGGYARDVVATVVSAGGDARKAAVAAIHAGGDAGEMTSAAVEAGGNAGDIAAGAIEAGGAVDAVVKSAIKAGGSVLDVVTAASSMAPDQVRSVVDSAVEVGGDSDAAEAAGAAGQTMGEQPVQVEKPRSPS